MTTATSFGVVLRSHIFPPHPSIVQALYQNLRSLQLFVAFVTSLQQNDTTKTLSLSHVSHLHNVGPSSRQHWRHSTCYCYLTTTKWHNKDTIATSCNSFAYSQSGCQGNTDVTELAFVTSLVFSLFMTSWRWRILISQEKWRIEKTKRQLEIWQYICILLLINLAVAIIKVATAFKTFSRGYYSRLPVKKKILTVLYIYIDSHMNRQPYEFTK